MKCPDCGGTHVRCTSCGTRFDLVSGVDLVLDILSKANAPLFGSDLAQLSGYSKPGMYNLLNRLMQQGKVERVGNGKQRRGYRVVKVLQFPQHQPSLERAA